MLQIAPDCYHACAPDNFADAILLLRQNIPAVLYLLKIKTKTIVKEVISDESIEILRDNCEEKRDLAIIDLLSRHTIIFYRSLGASFNLLRIQKHL